MKHEYQTFDEVLSAVGFTERDASHGEGHRQRDVFEAFRAGKHVILHAPTGWGKTFAVTAALEKGHCIYSLPMRSLVDSVSEGVHDLGPEGFRLKKCAAHHGARRQHKHLDQGEDPGDPIQCVFTTLDQTLSAFLGIPVGVSMRQGNIMPAVVDASHLVFDEFHLFEPERSWTTALFALQRSRQNGIVLTATLSDVMVEFLRECLQDSEVGEVAVVRGQRTFVNEKVARRGGGLDQVDQLEIGRRTIVIRNQVEWAQKTAEKLRRRGDIEGNVYLLHSELLPKDRALLEEEVRRVFSEDSDTPGVLVATQVVEAGIDITCDVMHTDLCPPPAFIQRIGRCARYEEEAGRIFWHLVETEMPYRGQGDEMKALRDYLGEKKSITPEAEHEIVNLAEERDRKAINDFQQRNLREVNRLRVDPDYSEYRQYIRNINSVNVAIGEGIDKPYDFLSVSQSKFYEGGKYDGAALPTTFVRYDSDRRVHDTVENWRLADFALLSPEYAQYDPDYGVRIGETGGEEHFIGERKTYTKHNYDAPNAEPYWLHIHRLKHHQPTCRWIFERLAADPHVGSLEAAEYLVDFVTWAHDLGKLNYPWQASFGVPRDGYPIAHSGGDFTEQKGMRRPTHGWMSAWAVRDFIWGMDATDELRKVVFWAIADHHGYSHGMKRSSLESFELCYLDHLDRIPEYMLWVRPEWNSSNLKTWVDGRDELERINTSMKTDLRRKPRDANDVYFALSYILRRTDQLATAMISSTEKVEKETKENSRCI